MNSVLIKSFLGSCILYFCIISSDASLSVASSAAIAAIERTVPTNVYNRINRNELSNRYKRDVITKTLADPENCIRQCDDAETKLILTATMKNVAILVAGALESVANDTSSTKSKTPEQKAAFKQQVEDKTIANLGPLFQDLCSAAKTTDDCFAQCPDSPLKKIITINHDNAQVLCEPQNNWSSFSDYYTALNCTNNTQTDHPCQDQCGKEVKIQNATNFALSENSKDKGGYSLTYESDAKKNDATVAPACKTYTCEIDCYKPIMTKKCGKKAYDMYVRTTQLDPHTGLSLLKELNAVDSVKECKQFQ